MSGNDLFGVLNSQGSYMEEMLRVCADGSPTSYLLTTSVERRAICCGSVLSLYDNGSTDAENIISELEFDSELNCVCWELSGSCLVVTDVKGNLHLVTNDGALLFSKKFVTDGVVSTMMFMAKETDMSVQSLVVVVSSGSILHIENMHLPAVCIAAKENKGTMLSLLQKLQVQKYSFPAPDGLRCAAVATEGPTVNAPTLAVLAFIDTNHNLCSAHLTLSNSGDGNMTNTLDSRLCSDMCLIHGADDQAYVLAIFNDECLVLIRLADGTLLGELKLLNKANRIVSKAASVAGDSGLLSSVILLTNENSMVTTEATATCQTYWLVCDSLSAKMMFIGSAVLQNGVKYGSVVRDSGLFGNTSALAASDTQEAVLLQCTTVVQTTITCLLDVSLAATTASPTTALEVVRKVVLDSFAARTEVAYVDTEQYLGYLSLATNATDAVGILHQLLQVAHPPEGFLRRLLHASEVAVESVSGKQHQGTKQRSLLEILRMYHLLETAETLRERTACEEETNSDSSPEEVLRLTLLSLTSSNVLVTLREFLQRGKLRHALLVVRRCVREALPFQPTEAVQLPPDDCVLEEYVAWVRDGVVHRLTFFNTSAGSQTAPVDGVVVVAAELVKRACSVERKSGSPVTAVRLAALARDLLSSTPSATSAACAQLIEEVHALHNNLLLQNAIWECWDDRVRLEEVVALGLQGLVFDRIDCADEAMLIEDLRANVLPLISEFRADADQLLSDWITETISTRIVQAGEDYEEEADNDNTTCTLSRLVKVASVVADRSVQAKIILILLQMPVMEEISLHSANGAGVAKQASGSRHLESTSMLCELATAASGFVSAATREALTEATRLLKIKALAASYGVGSFEPRNSKQVRSVVIIIASSVHRPDAVRDALEFASSWGSTSVDMKAVLSRALIQRASNLSLFLSSAVRFEEDLKRVLDALPEELKQVVVEDALTFILEDLESVSDTITYSPGGSGAKNSEGEAKTRAEMMVRAALHLVSHYLDVVREDPVVDSGDASHARRARFLEQSDCWINADLLASLKKILTLQSAHGIFLCLVDLSNKDVCRELVAELVQFRVSLLLKDVGPAATIAAISVDKRLTADNVPLDTASRKVCLLLNVCPTYFTHVTMKLLVEASQTELAMEVAQALSKEKFMHSSTSALLVNTGIDGSVTSGSENDEDAEKEASLLLDAAVTLCAIAAKKANQISNEDYPVLPSLSLFSSGQDAEMPEYLFFPIASFSLSRDLLRCSLAGCPSLFLGRTLDLLSGSETVLAVYDRVEGAAAAPREGNYEIISGVLSEGVFARDGILMQASSVAMALMKYSVGEVKRRGRHSSAELRNAQSNRLGRNQMKGAATTSMGAWDQPAADLEDLVRVLQRSENHLLATRVLYSSWHNGPAKSQLLKSSLLALCRKVLVYRDIDMSFAVACLAALSYDSMVKELKTAVPSIQSDFSRLQTVALVGEELSHLWDNEALLLLFQGLQTNAKWWHILSSLGMKVDLRVFQNPDAQVREKFIRSIIPELFEKCNMDLEMVTEYCRQFDLEPDCAALTYLEILLTAPPSSVGDFAWAGKVRCAAENVEEHSTLQRLRELLRRVHSLDYEKIRYVCTWIIDLLAAEEEPADTDTSTSIPEESDDTTTSFSLRSKAQKVSTAVLQAERGINQELAVYKRYVEIASYLVGLKFPRSATESIKPLPAGAKSPYDNMSGTYLERIPIWQLLDDPWSVLDPLLTTVPESAGKLAPLCLPLGLDKSVFNVRKILALYTRMTNTTTTTAVTNSADSATVGSTQALSVSQLELKKVAIQVASEAIDANLSNPRQRIELWRWIYERESSSGDDEHALMALQAALSVAQEYPSLTASSSSSSSTGDSGDNVTLLAQLSKEMQTLQCRRTVRQFNALIPDSPKVGAKLLSLIANPTQLIRLVLDVLLESSWDLFMQGLLRVGAPVTTYTVSQHPPNHPLLEFVHKAGALVDELARHGGFHLPPPSASEGAAPAAPTSQLELVRHNYIGKMLSDVDSNNVSERGDTLAGSSAAAQNARKAYWGTASDSNYEPSVAEVRRRDDMYLAMSIAVLTLSCSTANQRQAYETQLDSVMRGKGIRVMRRLTARSKFRAAQALFFLQSAATTTSSSADRFELTQHKSFLYCLAELQEIRLSCAEDSLLDALGMKISDGVIACVPSGADPRALVRTWLHDEGSHVDVVELARDLLVVTHFQDAGIWYQLVGHMTAKGLNRSLFQTMLMIECSPVFSDVCFGMLGSDVLAALVKIIADVVDRSDQVLQLFDARPAKLEWLFSKLSLDHTSASASTAPTGATSTGAATITTVSGDNNSNSSCSSSGSETAAHRHRVFLGPKLACRAEGWEEGAPEDLLPVVRECVRLAGAVMQAMSSRVRGKSQASVAALRSAVPRILVLLLQVTGGSVHSSIQRGISLCATAEREVAQNLRTTLLGAAEALMSSGIFGSAEEIADALATLSTADEKLLGHLLRGIGNAVDCAVLTSLLDSLLVSKGDHISADHLLWVLRAATSTSSSAEKCADGRLSHTSPAVAGSRPSNAILAQALVTCLENRLHDEEDLTCIRIVVRSLEGPTRTALVALLRGTARGSLAQVLAGSASSSSSAPCTAAPVGV